MPDWVWLITLFVGMSASYFCGYKLGIMEVDQPPSQKAWIEVRKYEIDRRTETEKYGIDKEHEFNMELMERGVYDPVEEKQKDDE